jgi:hypothetical protein
MDNRHEVAPMEVMNSRKRIEFTDDFRRKKRNILTISALSCLFSFSKTDLYVSLPGQSVNLQTPSLIFAIFLFLWLWYAYIEYEHELSHIRRSYSVWALEVEKSADIKTAIEEIAAFLQLKSKKAKDIDYMSKSMGMAKGNAHFKIWSEALNKRISEIVRISSPSHINPYRNEAKYVEDWNEAQKEIKEQAAAIESLCATLDENLTRLDQIFSEAKSREDHDRDSLWHEIKLYCDEKIPPSIELEKLHGDISSYDGRMFRYHEQAAPRWFARFGIVTLLLDIAIKIYNNGLMSI